MVDSDEYLLPVSRYIHRNPIETKKPLVERLEDYHLSSYSAYIGLSEPPAWLNQALVLSVLNTQQSYKTYQAYANHQNESSLVQFYGASKQASVLGSKAFTDKIKRFTVTKDAEISGNYLLNQLTCEAVVDVVAKHFAINSVEIINGVAGSRKSHQPRQIAMYLAKKHCDLTLRQLADYFNLSSYSTVSKQAKRLDLAMGQDLSLRHDVLELEQRLLSVVKT